MKSKVRKLGIIEVLKIILTKGMYVSIDDTLNRDEIISIKDGVSTEDYIKKVTEITNKQNDHLRELKVEISKLKNREEKLTEDNDKLRVEIESCEQKIKDATVTYAIKNKELKESNDAIRKENFRLKDEMSKVDDKIKKASEKYEKRLFNKREENRRLQVEIDDVRYMGASKASEILRRLSKFITNRKFIEFRKAIRGLEMRNSDLEEALVKCKNSTKM